MQTFPSYMKALVPGLNKTPVSIVNRSPMSDGLTKQAKIRNRALVSRDVVYMIQSFANYQAWETFFHTSINGGADWFNWLDPVDSVVKLARIVDGEFAARALNGIQTDWEVSFKIETWSV